jgi:uncharacterized protein (DUF1684 family)
MPATAAEIVDLLDWRRRVFDLYREVRTTAEPAGAWRRWTLVREELFASHPQSPVPEGDSTLPVLYDYDPSARVLTEIEESPSQRYEIPASGGGEPFAFSRCGVVHFTLDDEQAALELYWLEGYGGGLFLPFRDATAGRETYGAGRYLLDTVKGADLGMVDGRLVLDFNFSYQPSCSYDPTWVCPLAPPPNHLDIPIRAGERTA